LVHFKKTVSSISSVSPVRGCHFWAW